MIKGIDIGNHTTKDEQGNMIQSRYTIKNSLLDEQMTLEYNGQSYHLNEGKYEINLSKASKKMNIPLLLAILSKSQSNNFKIVTGLPVSQYKQCKESYKNELLNSRVYKYSLYGRSKNIVIEDVEIFPEGAGAYYSLSYKPKNSIVVDVGGGTTNICSFEGGKLVDSSSLGEGTHSIYTDIKDHLNSEYTLNLKLENIESVLKNGLAVDGTAVDFKFIRPIITEFNESLLNELREKYPYRTSQILLTGGGSQLVKGILGKMIKVEVIENNLFANAVGFWKVGKSIWKEEE